MGQNTTVDASDFSTSTDLSNDLLVDLADADSSDVFDATGGPKCNINRGMWMYRHPGQALGTDILIDDTTNDNTDELAVIANLSTKLVSRVYGNYGSRPIDDASDIAAWNALLDAAGIQSQVLIGDAEDIFPPSDGAAISLCRQTLLDEIQERFIDFNNGHLPAEQFKALHLDIEPQQYNAPSTSCGYRMMNYPSWSTLTKIQKAERYMMLLDTLNEVRQYLDSNGQGSAEIFIDLAPWVDSMPSMSFTWPSTFGSFTAMNGQDWLTQAAAIVDGITFMTYSYSRETATQIYNSVGYEVGLATDVRVSVNAKERLPYSTGTPLWLMDLSDMWSTVDGYELNYCQGMDLFAYKYIEE